MTTCLACKCSSRRVRLSGQAIGIIAKESTSLTDLDLKNNALGAHGATALVNGLGSAGGQVLHRGQQPAVDPSNIR